MADVKLNPWEIYLYETPITWMKLHFLQQLSFIFELTVSVDDKNHEKLPSMLRVNNRVQASFSKIQILFKDI